MVRIKEPNSERIFRVAALFILAAIFVSSYQNCDPTHEGSGQVDSFSYLKEPYQQTLYQYTSVTCNGCHAQGAAQAARPFADPDINVAFKGFMLVTQNGTNVAILKTKGTDSHSQTPATAPTQEHIDGLNAATDAYNDLLKGSSEPFTILSKELPLPTPVGTGATTPCAAVADTAAPTHTVNFPTDLVVQPSPSADGKITISVTRTTYGGSPMYCFSRPKITAPAGKKLTVKSLYFRYNGKWVDTLTTFSPADKTATADPGLTVPLDASNPNAVGIMQVRAFGATDKFQIGFGSVKNE